MLLLFLQKSHQGSIVIGESRVAHEAAGSRTKEINESLEAQFAEGLEHKLSGGARSHVGLGFHDSSHEVEATTGDKTHSDSEKDDDHSGAIEKSKEKEKEKEKEKAAPVRDRSRSPLRSSEKKKEPISPTDRSAAKSKYAMSFVKSSS